MPLPRAFADHATKETEDDQEEANDLLAVLRSSRDLGERRRNRNKKMMASSKWESTSSGEVAEAKEGKVGSKDTKQSPSTSHVKSNLVTSPIVGTNLPDYTRLVSSIKQVVDAQQRQHLHAKGTEEILQSIQQDVKQLQASVMSTERHSEDTTKSLDHMIRNGEVMSHSLSAMMQCLTDHIDNEKKAFVEQQSASETEREALRKDRTSLDAEKEQVARDRMQLERAEALFEQRKLAAAEQMEHAARTMAIQEEAEARLADEMRRLTQLREFIVRKECDAQEKLTRVEMLSSRMEDRESTVAQDFESAKRQQQEVAEERLRLARDRVSLLKERSKDRESRWLQSVRHQLL